MHRSVLLNEVVEILLMKGKRGGTYIDGTVGSGGHAEAILEKIGPGGFLLGIDRDEEAIGRAEKRLAGWAKQCALARGNYADMTEIAQSRGIKQADGILLDLGVSSEQFDSQERGFSFNTTAALDMRMDKSGGRTAADMVNKLPEEELTALFREFGEERNAKRIARAIVRERGKSSITTTVALAEIVARATGGRHGPIHPATRTFQALRIGVNDELEALRKGLSAGLNLLSEGGRMAVISFHSLEDRIVKECFKSHAGKWESMQAGGRKWVGETPEVRILTKKPVTPSDEEISVNRRSRSAKLRAVERLPENTHMNQYNGKFSK